MISSIFYFNCVVLRNHPIALLISFRMKNRHPAVSNLNLFKNSPRNGAGKLACIMKIKKRQVPSKKNRKKKDEIFIDNGGQIKHYGGTKLINWGGSSVG